MTSKSGSNKGRPKSTRTRSGSKVSKSSHRWMARQKRDFFVRQAQAEGHVSRAHYKLAQIDQRFKVLQADAWVLELGAAPGGWTNYLQDRLPKGQVIAVDPLPVTAHADTVVIEGLAGTPEVDEAIEECLGNRQLDLVLSDMAPNISGVRAVDQARAMDLADVSLDACGRWLRKGGHLVIKAFQGEGLDEWVSLRRQEFAKVTMTKPKASRSESREVFVVAQQFVSE